MITGKMKWNLAGLMFAAGAVMVSCTDDEISRSDDTNNEQKSYVVAATVDGTNYLLITESLDKGVLSTKGNGLEVIGATYWVYKDEKYVFWTCLQ